MRCCLFDRVSFFVRTIGAARCSYLYVGKNGGTSGYCRLALFASLRSCRTILASRKRFGFADSIHSTRGGRQRFWVGLRLSPESRRPAHWPHLGCTLHHPCEALCA